MTTTTPVGLENLQRRSCSRIRPCCSLAVAHERAYTQLPAGLIKRGTGGTGSALCQCTVAAAAASRDGTVSRGRAWETDAAGTRRRSGRATVCGGDGGLAAAGAGRGLRYRPGVDGVSNTVHPLVAFQPSVENCVAHID